ncbi:ATP-binding cassette domain-containing protein [Rhodoblastus acidophilus]|uniref:ATP-binding cassette domain-containing protein n=1 Tax=Candidatus Rhodoblastus alkanivorans TaxID=2954117 RepID=A0ABS9Z4Z4_9HYPH|nr:ATP-binding cassette domain-containing protein [Candidatus Rhodoblastus alkanivorans]MCI4679894.1 ATP-binding cassette domain-containing protein [Candidatus Rhodoblastus alkanivorans]MCI4682703.1 ATP-binding cassette domain-containing protein [Candidatus Rhodoblastus alkanivorans]MDI4640010.1 ATP-binding cassette domain-containing protein [Rhodoblastus acidophilus]
MALEIGIARKAYRLAGGGNRLVFDQFALDVAEGAIVALLGPSGCGKSSLLRIVAGLDRDFSGAVKGAPRRIGMVFQEPRLLPWRNVADNLRLAAPGLDDPGLQALLAAFELDGRGADYPGQLSLGLARRAALARAFAVEPELLLLDEPFASLDRALHLRLRALLARRIGAKKMTALIATHDLDDALMLADEIIFLDRAPTRIKGRLPIAAPRGARDENLTKLRASAEIYYVIDAPGSGNPDSAS